MTDDIKSESLFSIPVEVKEKKIEVKPFLLYVLIRSGSYRHEIAGVYPSEERAREVAKELLGKEPDSWHDYEIQPVKFNQIPDFFQDGETPDYFGEIIKELPSEMVYNTKSRA